MNDGILSAVTRMPLAKPDHGAAADAGCHPEQWRTGELDHARGQARGQRDVRANREVEASGEDDQG